MDLTIEKLFKNSTPFAVIQYFEWFKTQPKEKHKKYELIYLVNKELMFEVLDLESIDFLKKNNIKQVINNNDGVVWEFNDFKNYKSYML